jgi:hypothetical protein
VPEDVRVQARRLNPFVDVRDDRARVGLVVDDQRIEGILPAPGGREIAEQHGDGGARDGRDRHGLHEGGAPPASRDRLRQVSEGKAGRDGQDALLEESGRGQARSRGQDPGVRCLRAGAEQKGEGGGQRHVHEDFGVGLVGLQRKVGADQGPRTPRPRDRPANPRRPPHTARGPWPGRRRPRGGTPTARPCPTRAWASAYRNEDELAAGGRRGPCTALDRGASPARSRLRCPRRGRGAPRRCAGAPAR